MKTKSYTLSAVFAALAPILFSGIAEAALVSYQPLDTSTGLTLNNGAAITSGSQGKFGEAVSLDGTDDWASVTAGNPVTGSGNRTVSAWVYMDAVTGVDTVASFGLNAAQNSNVNGGKWDLDIDSNITTGGIEVGVAGGRTNGTGLTGLTGNWMLLTSTLSGGTTIANVSTYLNGGLTTTTASSSQAINTANANFFLGRTVNITGDLQYLDGRIDDMAIWNEALTVGEIKGLYDIGMSVDLSYTADTFDLLKQRHDLATGSTTIGALEWAYATGLTGPAGLTSGPGGYTLVLDAANGTGLTAIPESSAVLLGGLGLLGLLRRRR
jgi:hypothetical protein